ncbi:MAG: hypothetical protein ABII12_02140 [Planctomycetota bacterium]
MQFELSDRQRVQFAPAQPGQREHFVDQGTFPPPAFQLAHVLRMFAQRLSAQLGSGVKVGVFKLCPLPCSPASLVLTGRGVFALDDAAAIFCDGPEPCHFQKPPQFILGKRSARPSAVRLLVTLRGPREWVCSQSPRLYAPEAERR